MIYLGTLIDGVYHSEGPEIFQFPGGEYHLRNIPDYPAGRTTLIADVRGADANDLVKAVLWATCIPHVDYALLLPYIPAARADRGKPLGIGAYSAMVDAVGADYVVGLDPHSPIAPRYIGHYVEADFVPLLERAVETHPKYDAVIAPDKGAQKRAERAAKALGLDVYTASKLRDFETGKILKIKMDEVLPKGGNYLVVDDICDGGGTFVGLAQAMEDSGGYNRLGLWVTHGIFSGAATMLRDYYDNIYTTDSHPGHSRVGVATTIIPTKIAMLNTLKEALCKTNPSSTSR